MNIVSTELITAAMNGDKATLQPLLLRSDCDAKSTDSEGTTALMYAAAYGHTTCLQLLLPLSDV